MKRSWPGTLRLMSSKLTVQFAPPHKNCVHAIGDRHRDLSAFAAIIFLQLFYWPLPILGWAAHQSAHSSTCSLLALSLERK
jgi:hypothetical protein